jgi:ATPase subunit of ABC transporter with duplicated ATPase domains
VSRQFIYHMRGLTKAYPNGKKVLENIHLSFYPDAKIGVLGVNGAGKSTLLRIMAGIDKEWSGEGWVAEGARVGYLPQEPQLDPTKNVRENVMEGVAPQRAILERYNDLAMNYSDETADEMTRLQDEIEAKGLWDLDSKVDQAMDALRCPPDDWPVDKLSGGEKRRGGALQAAARTARAAAPRRAHQPPRRRDHRLARRAPAHLSGRDPDRAPTTATSSTTSPAGSWSSTAAGASPTRATTRPGSGRSRSAWSRRAARTRRTSAPSSASASGCRRRPRPGRPSRRPASSATRTSSPRRTRRGRPPRRSSSRSPSAWAQRHRVRRPQEGLRDKLLIDGLSFKLPPGGIVGIIGPNGAGKTTLFRMITGQEQPDDGAIRIGESVKLGYVDQSRDSLDAGKTLYEEISGGNEILYLGKREINARAYCGAFNFKGSTSRRRWACSRAASATGCTSPRS